MKKDFVSNGIKKQGANSVDYVLKEGIFDKNKEQLRSGGKNGTINKNAKIKTIFFISVPLISLPCKALQEKPILLQNYIYLFRRHRK